MMVCHGLTWPVMVCHGPSWSVMVCHDLSWSVMVCHGHGLSWSAIINVVIKLLFRTNKLGVRKQVWTVWHSGAPTYK